VIRPERFARLVTLAGMLIGAARDERRLAVADVLAELHLSFDELREDLEVLNVVNFGGGTYVLFAQIDGDEIEVDADTYGDNFARPARLSAAIRRRRAGGRLATGGRAACGFPRTAGRTTAIHRWPISTGPRSPGPPTLTSNQCQTRL
jgi:hypothetical protein